MHYCNAMILCSSVTLVDKINNAKQMHFYSLMGKEDTVLKFCWQFVLQNVLINSCFPANFCHGEHVNGEFKRKKVERNLFFPGNNMCFYFFCRNKFSHVPFLRTICEKISGTI
jgi:hypothetical protein